MKRFVWVVAAAVGDDDLLGVGGRQDGGGEGG